MKRFRNNVVVLYEAIDKPDKYRPLITSTLINLASLYRLDYYIEENKKDWPNGANLWIADLAYFRSTNNTQIDGKFFRKLINDLFSEATSFGFLSIDIFCQTQKGIKSHPFPKEFYRPLNYPFVEHHKDNRMLLKVHAAALMTIDES